MIEQNKDNARIEKLKDLSDFKNNQMIRKKS